MGVCCSFFKWHSTKALQIEELNASNVDSAVLSSCTKWEQVEKALVMLEGFCTTKCEDETVNMANGTKNSFILYSSLHELKLIESPKPKFSNHHIQHENGYIGLGFISHIVNSTRGLVYISDVAAMPDPVIVFGIKPKPMLHTPRLGEIFGYLFQNKYFVRAIRIEYDLQDTLKEEKCTVLLIDIGCKIRIDIDPNFSNLFEVTVEGGKLQSFTKAAHLLNIPPNLCIYDLLHTRVQYKVICNMGEYMIADILASDDPFKQLDEVHFYMFFLCHNLDDTLIKCHKNREAANDAYENSKIDPIDDDWDPNQPESEPSSTQTEFITYGTFYHDSKGNRIIRPWRAAKILNQNPQFKMFCGR